jgi:small subunit ribosomal protein S5
MARQDNAEKADSEFIDRLVHINRVSKTVKGGKRYEQISIWLAELLSE